MPRRRRGLESPGRQVGNGIIRKFPDNRMAPQDRDARTSASPADRPTIPPTAALTPVPPSTTVIRAVPTGPLTLGQTFGRYHIVKLLGIGGMAGPAMNWPVWVTELYWKISVDE